MVMMAVVLVIGPAFEADLLDNQYGFFRPGFGHGTTSGKYLKYLPSQKRGPPTVPRPQDPSQKVN